MSKPEIIESARKVMLTFDMLGACLRGHSGWIDIAPPPRICQSPRWLVPYGIDSTLRSSRATVLLRRKQSYRAPVPMVSVYCPPATRQNHHTERDR